MLVKITKSCHFGCTHCMNDARPCDDHMSLETLERAVHWGLLHGVLHYVVTGGEPTEHPQFEQCMESVRKILSQHGALRDAVVTVTTNGLWCLENPDKAMDIRDMFGGRMLWQVSLDERYYPNTRVKSHNRLWREPGFVFCDHCVEKITPLGRAKGWETDRKCSSCFNIRAIAHQLQYRCDLSVDNLLRQMQMHNFFCEPAVTFDGKVCLGESDLCPSVGDIQMDERELLQRILDFRCDGCDWQKDGRLPVEALRLIGEA